MSQKASKEEMPKLIAELVNRQSNLKTIELIEKFLATVHVAGAESVSNLSRCFSWLIGVSQGEALRVKELKELLPDQDTKVKLGPEEPAEEPEPVDAAQISQGGVEISKGSPVFEQA
jgi:hypothetical protein